MSTHETSRPILHYTGIPMRAKIASKPCFPFVHHKQPQEYRKFQERYNSIDQLLEANPAILEAVHADLARCCSDKGRESEFSSEQFFRMLLIKVLEGLSYRDVIIRVTDSDFLRNFSRINSGTMMNFTVLEMAAKCILPSTWEKINDILSGFARRRKKITGDQFRMDSTVCEANIHYPTDASLCWDGFRVLARLIRQCVEADPRLDTGNRFHDRKVKRLFAFISTHAGKKTASTRRSVRHSAAKLCDRVDWICDMSRAFLRNGETKGTASVVAIGLLGELRTMLPRVEQVVGCAHRANNGETVPAADRIFSIFEPHAELLKRGKARKPVEFGHMVTIGQTKEKFISFYSVEEKSRHDIHMGDEALKDHKKKFGTYPNGVAADKNYYGGPEHTAKWEKRIEHYAVGKKGRRDEEETAREHSIVFRLLQKFRAGCEGSISVLKRAFGLIRCLNRGFNSFASSIGNIVFCHNLVVLSRL